MHYPRVLVAVPQHESTPPAILAKLRACLGRLSEANPALELELYEFRNAFAPALGILDHRAPYAPHAAARNALLNLVLRDDHDYVLWLDADLVEFPPDLPQQLLTARRGGQQTNIIAPLVLIEGTTLFYDTHGFRELHGARVQAEPPYFQHPGHDVLLASVGCCYLAPAWLYLSGIRYAPTPNHTEHWSVMQAARDRGVAIHCYPEVVVYHANLPHYGQEFRHTPTFVL